MIDVAVLAGVNHLLEQSAWARQRLAPFAGHHARLSLGAWALCFSVTDDGLFEAAAKDAASEVVIRLPDDAPWLAMQGSDKLLQATRIEGGAQFASELTDVLKKLRWDYEEDFSRIVGDIAAHRIVDGLGAFMAWQKAAAARMGQRFAVAATEEHRWLLGRSDAQEMAADLDGLRTALAAAERRIDALASRIGTRP
jgi:ubiquinone biosynthesis protein UbiJ